MPGAVPAELDHRFTGPREPHAEPPLGVDAAGDSAQSARAP